MSQLSTYWFTIDGNYISLQSVKYTTHIYSIKEEELLELLLLDGKQVSILLLDIFNRYSTSRITDSK